MALGKEYSQFNQGKKGTPSQERARHKHSALKKKLKTRENLDLGYGERISTGKNGTKSVK